MNSSPIYHLRLFGSPSIAGEDGTLLTGRAAQRHRLALLALLALSPGRGTSREKVMAYLWPERDTEHARQLLNQAVYNLRKALGEEALLSGADDLRLNPEVIRADVAEFEAALERGDPAPAVRLCQGPFLDGFFLSEAPEFEHWVDGERERLAGAYAKALEALAGAAERQGDFPGAAEWWKLRAAHDPNDSRVAYALMQALDAAGNRAGALQHAAMHQRLLEEEFGAEPDPEVLVLAERLRHDPAARSESSPERLPPATPASNGRETVTLAAQSSPAPPPATAPPASRRLPPAVRYGVAALLLGAVLFGAMWLGLRGTDAPPPPATQEPSIAVLPFANLSRNPAEEYFGDALTEEILNALAQVPGLKVMARTSALQFKDRAVDVREVARQLGVSHLLEGSVQRAGGQVRITAQLIDGSDGYHLWSQRYDRELKDVFAVQDEIARAVARELGVRLTAATSTPLRRQPTQNVAAYELYLRGSDPALHRTAATRRVAMEYFRQAIALDSTYAAPYAAMAGRYISGRLYPDIPSRDRLALAEEAALRALSRDDLLAEAHVVLGLVQMNRYDWVAAEQQLERAIALDPTRALPHELLVGLYIWTGRLAAALEAAARALELDRLSPSATAELARALAANGRCDEALLQLEKIAALQPPLLRAAPIAAQCYALQQQWLDAIAVMRQALEERAPRGQALLAYLLHRGGHREEARAIHDSLLDAWRGGTGDAFALAIVHLGLGDRDQAFAFIDRAIDDLSLMPAPGPISIMDPLFEELHRDPRFARLRERLGLPRR